VAVDAPEVEDETAGGEGDLLMATASAIAEWVGADAPRAARVGEGEPGAERAPSGAEMVRVSGMADAGEDSVVFATDHKALGAALRSGAGLILASRDLEAAGDGRLLWVRDAKLAFAMVAARLQGRPGGRRIDARAFVEDAEKIGEGTRVGPGTVIGVGVRIGRDCDIQANVTIYAGTMLADRVVVQAGAVLGSAGFGYVRDGETGEYLAFPQQGVLVIEEDVEIGANTTIDRGALGETRIGRGTKIDNLVHIAHNCRIGRQVVIAAQTGISGSTVVEDGAVIGGQVGIGDHAMIGTGVILGSGSGVLSGKKLRGPGEVFWGIPAQPLRSYLRDLARLRRGKVG